MTHGNLGLLTENWIWLPNDLLRPLSVFDGDEVYAFYYPTPRHDGKHDNCLLIDDIMLTPIPPNMWGRVARIVVRLNQKQGMLAPICEFLAKSGISIVDAECTRSAHRYATWNAVLGFDSDLGQDSDVQGRLDQLRRELRENFDGTCLFVEPDICGLKEPVETYSMHSLQYFHSLLKHNGSGGGLEHRDFRFKVVKGRLQDQEHLLLPLIAKMPGWDHSNSRPLCVFAEADTRAFVIRMAIVPPKKLNSYFKLTVPYTRISGGSTSGLLSAILDKFSDNYNLWRVFNDTNVNKDHFEKGEATLFGQDESTLDDHGSGESVAAQVRTRLKDLDDRDVTLPQSTVHMGPVKVKPLRYQEIRANLEEQHEHDAEFKYQVFLSSDDTDVDYAREIFTKLKAAGIGCFWYKVNIVGGTRIPDAILEAIEQSEEMCVLVTQNSVKSIWVASEWGAMWAKGRRIISVLTQEVNERRLPEQLRSRAFYKYPAGVEQYIKLLEQPL